jgi:triosephosphate isomerase
MTAEIMPIKTAAETSLAAAFAELKARLPGGALAARREAAFRRFETEGLPHRHVEAWKYTDLRNLMRDAKPIAGPPDVAAKARAARRAGLKAIVCIGETKEQRDAGEAHRVCCSQLDASVPDGATAQNTVVAYEPVWAIGTGKTATSADIRTMHAHIRAGLVKRLGADAREILILYGGSVNPDNANEILNLPEVDGALVGGASLKCDDFLRIIAAIKPS